MHVTESTTWPYRRVTESQVYSRCRELNLVSVCVLDYPKRIRIERRDGTVLVEVLLCQAGGWGSSAELVVDADKLGALMAAIDAPE